MTSLINFSQNEIIIENATILENSNVSYTIRRYQNREGDDDKIFQTNIDEILNKTKYILNDDDLFMSEDFIKQDVSPHQIKPLHIKDTDIKKPDEKEPNLIKFIIDKFSAKTRKRSTVLINTESDTKNLTYKSIISKD